MEQKNYWNLISNTKEFTTPFQTDIFCSYVNKDSVILDIGCGYGRTLNELYSLGYKHLTFTTRNGHTSNGFYFLGKNLIESTGEKFESKLSNSLLVQYRKRCLRYAGV